MGSILSDFLENMSECDIKQTMGVDDNPERSSVGKFMRHTGGENPIEYHISAKDGELLARAEEQKGNSLIPYSLRNHIIGKRRAMVLLIKNPEDEVVLCLRRSFYIFASTTIVKNHNNQVLAYILGQFNPLYENYDIRGKDKKLKATVRSPIWKWTFPVLNLNKKPIGMIRKKLPDLAAAMTYRDHLNIQFSDQTLEEKILLLATALIIGIEH